MIFKLALPKLKSDLGQTAHGAAWSSEPGQGSRSLPQTAGAGITMSVSNRWLDKTQVLVR